MNKKEECELARDLAVKYIEKSLNDGSEKFVRNHLENCEDCRKYYTVIESKTGDEKDDKIIINQFKKINKHINILKLALITILIIILIASFMLWYKQNTFSNLVNKVSEKVEYLETLNNYKITVKTIYKNFNNKDNIEYYEEYYYKDGKLKEESSNSIFFLEDDSYDSISVYHDLKQIEYHHNNYIKCRKGKSIGILSYIKENYKEIASTIYSLAFSVKEDSYNGIDCYVIRFGNTESYRDIWIEKNSFITIREVNEKRSSFYSERVFTFEENIVTDNDVSSEILNSEEYGDYEKININTELSKENIKLYNSIYDE